jgi:hypothetical protein
VAPGSFKLEATAKESATKIGKCQCRASAVGDAEIQPTARNRKTDRHCVPQRDIESPQPTAARVFDDDRELDDVACINS